MKYGFRHQPKLDVEYRCICEIRHALNVEHLLDLSTTVY